MRVKYLIVLFYSYPSQMVSYHIFKNFFGDKIWFQDAGYFTLETKWKTVVNGFWDEIKQQ